MVPDSAAPMVAELIRLGGKGWGAINPVNQSASGLKQKIVLG